MGFFSKIFRRSKGDAQCHSLDVGMPDWMMGGVSRRAAMEYPTFFACVDAISSDVAKLPLEPYKIDSKGRKTKARADSTYTMLNLEPSPGVTRYTFLQSLVISVILNGDGFATIERNSKGVATSMRFEQYNHIVVYQLANGGGIDCYYNLRTSEWIEPSDMIHIRNLSYDGVRGVSTLDHARKTLGYSTSAEDQAGKIYSRGGVVNGVLSYEGVVRLDKDRKDEIRREWQRTLSQTGGIAILDGGARYQGVNVDPDKMQLLQGRMHNTVEVCRFFRMSPVKVGDLSKSSYSTVEAVNTAYLTDTLSSYLVKIEQELLLKIYPPELRKVMHIQFDASAILKADSSSQATLIGALAPYGAYTTNEIRERLNLPPVEGGDEPFVMSNMQRLGDPSALQGDNNQ